MFGSRIFHTEFDQEKERERERERKIIEKKGLQRRKAYSLLGVAASDP